MLQKRLEVVDSFLWSFFAAEPLWNGRHYTPKMLPGCGLTRKQPRPNTGERREAAKESPHWYNTKHLVIYA